MSTQHAYKEVEGFPWISDLNKNIMFMFEVPVIKHVGRIAIHKVSLARFKGVLAEKYLKALCGNDLGLTNGHYLGGHDPGVTNGHYLGGLIQGLTNDHYVV
jgi:hypothetical protein